MAVLRVNAPPGVVMWVTRTGIKNETVVYVLLANRALRYPLGRSRVAYIGTTSRGIDRIAGSVAYRAREVLKDHGIKSMEVRVVTSQSARGRVKTWQKLERALLLAFRAQYGAIPRYNGQGQKIRETDEFDFFNRERIRRVVLSLG